MWKITGINQLSNYFRLHFKLMPKLHFKSTPNLKGNPDILSFHFFLLPRTLGKPFSFVAISEVQHCWRGEARKHNTAWRYHISSRSYLISFKTTLKQSEDTLHFFRRQRTSSTFSQNGLFDWIASYSMSVLF